MEAKQTPLIDLRAALAQQAEPTVTEDMKSAVRWAPSSAYWSERLREFFGPDAREGIDALERRLAKAQQAEPVAGCETEADCTSQPWCRIRGECQRKQAEPVAGKVVAWGVFALADGEWQLQHPVFVGDEQGKASAEFERASYSGPQPLEVRPLGVVTATAQQAEPAQEPITRLFGTLPVHDTQQALAQQAEPVEPGAWVASKDGRVIYDDASTDDGLLRVSGAFKNDEQRVRYAQRIVDKLNAALAQQAEPVEPVAWNWMLDGLPYGQAYYGNPPDTDIAERAAIAGRTVRLLYTAPPQRKPLPKHDQHCVDVPGYGLMAVRLVRAVERAHGIKE